MAVCFLSPTLTPSLFFLHSSWRISRRLSDCAASVILTGSDVLFCDGGHDFISIKCDFEEIKMGLNYI